MSTLRLLSPRRLRTWPITSITPEHGDALVLIAGPNFMPQAYANTPLAQAAAVRSGRGPRARSEKLLNEGFIAQPTELGRGQFGACNWKTRPKQSHSRWQEAAVADLISEVSDLKPGAQSTGRRPLTDGPGRQAAAANHLAIRRRRRPRAVSRHGRNLSLAAPHGRYRTSPATGCRCSVSLPARSWPVAIKP